MFTRHRCSLCGGTGFYQCGEACPYTPVHHVATTPKETAMHNMPSPRPVTDESIEAAIVARGLTAPRVTPLALEANIIHEVYFTAGEKLDFGVVAGYKYPGPLDLLTFCVLVLRNGFTVTGESACASPENFDAAIGRKIARENAKQKVWALMGYELKSKLAAA
jgi:hypothetical protein